jgi:hypothetical protein
MDSSNTKRRWYDHDATANDFFQAMQALPQKIQEIICHFMHDLIEGVNASVSLSENYRTMGYQRLAALHLAKNKRREYDDNRLLHNTMSAMVALDIEKRNQILQQATLMLRSVLEYLKRHRAIDYGTNVEHVYELCLRSLETGAVIIDDILNVQKPVLYDEGEPAYVIRRFNEPAPEEEIAPLEE